MRSTSFLLVALMLNAPVMAGAEKVTPWGDPDLPGVWTNQTTIPLERPDALGGKRFYCTNANEISERSSSDS
jgi:hypothetical protein